MITEIEHILEQETLYSFYGVYGETFKLGNLVFEALEDPDDGYRSHLESILLVKSDGIFVDKPIINLYYNDNEVFLKLEHSEFELVDDTGHVWLSIGTDYTDGYYPLFVFEYTPRTDITEFSQEINNLDKFDPQSLHAEKLI
jgi:hypothetical protein